MLDIGPESEVNSILVYMAGLLKYARQKPSSYRYRTAHTNFPTLLVTIVRMRGSVSNILPLISLPRYLLLPHPYVTD